jgi:hypothetical protein
VKTVTYGYPNSNVRSRTVYLTTDGARTFQEVIPQISRQVSTGADLVQTAEGILRYREVDEGPIDPTRTLDRSLDGGHTWLPQSLPPDLPQPSYYTGSALVRVPFAPAGVLLHLGNYLAYSSDSGQTWQRFGDLMGLGTPPFYISPYYPPTLLQVGVAGALYTLPLPLTGAHLMQPTLPTHAPDSRFFSETGHTLTRPFRAYWERHGGLAQFGYPITDAFEQVSSAAGRAYTTQYFERARLEYHPEIAPPNDVVLSALGTAAYRQRYGAAGARAHGRRPVPHLLGAARGAGPAGLPGKR